MTFMDLSASPQSPAGSATASLLKRVVLGNCLMPNLFVRIPDSESELRQLVDKVCHGIVAAEENLLSTPWHAGDPGLDPAVRSFVAAAEVRTTWQSLRSQAAYAVADDGFEDFWHTHLSAKTMTTALQGALGDTFQLLLTVLWLYTREAWLRHILDILACALHTVGASPNPNATNQAGAAEGATGATPLWLPGLPGALQPLAPLVDTLAPCMQLVQSSLSWFEEAGVRHANASYRPISVPMLGLQRLIDRYLSARREMESREAAAAEVTATGLAVCGPNEPNVPLGGGAWVSLASGTFFSALSSKSEAIRRMSRTRCNVLLVIRPDEGHPCYPKHMSLRGSTVDDVLFPLGVLFRITRITRTVSSDLDPNVRSACRWPVMIIELAAADRFLDVLELLDNRGDLSAGELEIQLQKWIEGAGPDDAGNRRSAAAELLSRLPAYKARAEQVLVGMNIATSENSSITKD